jgi:hypothetical protein
MKPWAMFGEGETGVIQMQSCLRVERQRLPSFTFLGLAFLVHTPGSISLCTIVMAEVPTIANHSCFNIGYRLQLWTRHCALYICNIIQ